MKTEPTSTDAKNREPPSVAADVLTPLKARLLSRIREVIDLPRGAVEFCRRHYGRNQRSNGAWSWLIKVNGMVVCGSQWSMREVATAERVALGADRETVYPEE